MFAIGDKKWSGLGKLSEESGELVQVIGQLIQTRGKRRHWKGIDLKKNLEHEIADVKAAIAFVIEMNKLDAKAIQKRHNKKLKKFHRWHRAGDKNVVGK